jgi:VanZ family protein
MDKIKKFIKLWFPPIFYAILIFYGSSIEGPFIVDLEVGNIDKLIHFLEYLFFGFLLIRAIRGSDARITKNTAILLTFIIGTFYGFTDELHQSVIPGRFATISDFIADSIGTFIGAVIYTAGGHFTRKNSG